jgi:hypothetical protein
MEPQGSLPRSRGSATGFHPEPDKSSLHPPNSNIILPSTLRSSKWFLPFRFSNHNIVCIYHLSHPCYMSRPSHTHWIDRPNNIWWRVQVMKLIIMQPSPASRHFLRLRSQLFSSAPCSYIPDGRPIFRRILRKWGVRVLTEFIHVRLRSSGLVNPWVS